MMGHTHMMGGAAGWLGLCALVQPSPKVVVAGTGLAVAGALAPDIDHRSADAAQFLRLAGTVLVGLGFAGAALLGWATGGWPLFVAAGLLLAVLPWAVRPRHGGGFRGIIHSEWGLGAWALLAFIPCLITAAWPVWAAAALVTGWVTHLVLDAMTREGLPVPYNRARTHRLGFVAAASSMTTHGKARGWRKHPIRARLRSGPEYWAVQPALCAAIIVAALAAMRGGR